MRKIRITLLGIVGAATVGLLAVPAGAATPAVAGCVGQSVSAAASQSSGGAFGHFVVGVTHSQDKPGVGATMQALQSGAIDDSLFPNTCNGS